VVKGVTDGCVQAGCALLGGETAEMPGFYQPGEYDLAGFTVGVVEKDQMINGSQIEVGDVAIGLASSGIHSNGYSLVRKIIETVGAGWDDRPAEFGGLTVGEVYLTPTQIYVKTILAAKQAKLPIRGMAHITGGGLPENLPRCLQAGLSVQVDRSSWLVPAAFQWLATQGQVSERDMYHTFNMGIGYVVIVPGSEALSVLDWFKGQGVMGYSIGQVVNGNRELLGIPA
jgi:phosphoribosylformylglycinamidine cyclo-ligase